MIDTNMSTLSDIYFIHKSIQVQKAQNARNICRMIRKRARRWAGATKTMTKSEGEKDDGKDRIVNSFLLHWVLPVQSTRTRIVSCTRRRRNLAQLRDQRLRGSHSHRKALRGTHRRNDILIHCTLNLVSKVDKMFTALATEGGSY
jgi:hypothetical protein